MSSLLLGLVFASAVAQTPAPPASAEPAVPRLNVPIASGMTEPRQPSAPFQKLFAAPAVQTRRRSGCEPRTSNTGSRRNGPRRRSSAAWSCIQADPRSTPGWSGGRRVGAPARQEDSPQPPAPSSGRPIGGAAVSRRHWRALFH